MLSRGNGAYECASQARAPGQRARGRGPPPPFTGKAPARTGKAPAPAPLQMPTQRTKRGTCYTVILCTPTWGGGDGGLGMEDGFGGSPWLGPAAGPGAGRAPQAPGALRRGRHVRRTLGLHTSTQSERAPATGLNRSWAGRPGGGGESERGRRGGAHHARSAGLRLHACWAVAASAWQTKMLRGGAQAGALRPPPCIRHARCGPVCEMSGGGIDK